MTFGVCPKVTLKMTQSGLKKNYFSGYFRITLEETLFNHFGVTFNFGAGFGRFSWVHAQGLVRQHSVLRRVLGRVLEKGSQF